MSNDPIPVPIHHGDLLSLFGSLVDADSEMAAVAFLGPDRSLLGMRHIAGAGGHVILPIRSIARDALAVEAVAAILAHNHPGGDPQPSPDDLVATRLLARALATIGVTLLDHVVLARGGAVVSLAALGQL